MFPDTIRVPLTACFPLTDEVNNAPYWTNCRDELTTALLAIIVPLILDAVISFVT